MSLTRRDAHFRSKPVPESIAEPRAGVPEHAGRIAPFHERARSRLRLRHDRLSMTGTMLIDVGYRLMKGRDGFDGEVRGEVLGVVGFGSGSLEQGSKVWVGSES